MNELMQECILSDEQRSVLLKAIKSGKEEFISEKQRITNTITKKSNPFRLTDLVNTFVSNSIEANPHMQMKVYVKQSGFHPYIVIHDTIKNTFILVLKLPKNKWIFNPSKYRGEFASSNVDRLTNLGIPKEELIRDTPYQASLNLGATNQPFGIIICYDSKSDIVFEGALRPDQEDWLYKEDISDYIDIQRENIVPINNYDLSEIEISLKPNVEEDIVVKLKKNK
ncbi:hypothetical protein [Exiguobacterium indicum]|uniref:hypothetical protein n=1 Tax=Exiguobacterium indicum TaxID=296995 RepID=UPI002B263FE6|nr:hypothetical protein [Exiguobacterium indicum]